MIHPLQVLREAKNSLDDYQRVNVSNSTANPTSRKTEEKRWAPPPGLMLKINFDAALDVSKGVVGLGILARDEGGHVIGA
jgi:hypothetical protein